MVPTVSSSSYRTYISQPILRKVIQCDRILLYLPAQQNLPHKCRVSLFDNVETVIGISTTDNDA
jgi:hypothetical protein